MEALDNPSYFRMSGQWEEGEAAELLVLGKPRERDMPPEQRRSVSQEKLVFGSGSQVRYYNLSQQQQHAQQIRRRHSLGTIPRPPRPPPVGFPKGTNMLDIVLVSSRDSEEAGLWVTYLTSCFQNICKEEKKPPFKLLKVSAEEILAGFEVTSPSRLQIAILCPTLMKMIGHHPGVPRLASLLQPATVLAMLLGVSPNDVDGHQLSSLFRFEHWRKLVVKDQDPTFVGDFLGIAMDVLQRSWQLQHALTQVKTETNNRSMFSIIPKKVTTGQNKLIVLLNEPLGTTDKVRIQIGKSGEKIDVNSFKKRNPYTLQFSMPYSCLQTSMLVTVHVESNGRNLGQKLVKCESRLRELDQILRTSDNPLLFMCQALGLGPEDKDQLDMFLVSALQKNMPPNFNLLSSFGTPRPFASKEEFPTLLHFGANYGLEKLCWQLLECPGGEEACQIKNGGNMTPADLAEKSGHVKLCHALKGFLQMTELSSMYTYLKGASEKPQGFTDCNYLLPRPVSDTYMIPPPARPVTLFPTHDSYQVPPSPVSLNSFGSSPLDNYQTPQNGRPFTPLTPSTPSSPLDIHPFSSAYLHMNSINIDYVNEKKQPDSTSINNEISSLISNHHYMNTSSSSSISSKASPEEELVEIINDFKNNVLTISEVEKLVDAWRNRNDVQQSFKEKQEQLNKMRQEYDRIQQALKDEMKRPTPFERIKKFFTRKSRGDTPTKGKNTSDSSNLRPLSSLSLHSSCSTSSSGRLSTASGTSMGDSGTHSDPDDKKSEILHADGHYHDRLKAVKEIDIPESGDQYVNSSVFIRDSTKYSLPQPPGGFQRTIVEVHRCEVVNEEEPGEVTKPLLEMKKEPETIKEVPEEESKATDDCQGDLSSDSISQILEEDATVAELSSDEKEPSINEMASSELEILEQSERLLKDMADTLPYKDSKKAKEKKDLNNLYINMEISEFSKERDAQSLTTHLSDIDINSNSNLHEYMNVSGYSPPPIPPKCKYKNVIL